MANVYWDYVNGNDSTGDGSSGNPYKTLDVATTGALPGDQIRCAKSPDPVSLGNVTFTNKSKVLTLASAATLLIDDCEGGWTASANVSVSYDNNQYKSGSTSLSLSVANGFTTGKVAYRNLGTTIDLSSYDSLTFWMWTDTVSPISGLQVRLCSDTAGATAVNTLAIPSAMIWSTFIPITIDTGSALGSSIKSIAIYATSDPGVVVLNFDNFSACNDFSLQSLIGKNVSGDVHWYPIQSINNATIAVDGNISATTGSSTMPTYYGISETTTGYYRNAIILEPTYSDRFTVSAAGTSSFPIDISGGWDLSGPTQSGLTFFSGLSGASTLLTNSQTYTIVSKFGFTGSSYGSYAYSGYLFYHDIWLIGLPNGLYFSLQGGESYNITATGCNVGVFVDSNCYGVTLHDLNIVAGTNTGLQIDGASIKVYDSICNYCVDQNIFFISVASNCRLQNCVAKDGLGYGLYYWGKMPCYVYSCDFSDADGYSVYYTSQSELRMYNCQFNSSTPFSVTGNELDQARGAFLTSDHHNQDPDSFMTIFPGGNIESNDTVRHTAAGYSMQFSPTSTDLINEYIPLARPILEIACAANVAQTVEIWALRSSTGLSMRFLLRGGQIAGVASDVYDDISAAADTWEQLSLSFTPTEDGVVEIVGRAWGGTAYNGYFHDLSY